MNSAQLHLLLNHLPSIGQLAGFGAFLVGMAFRMNIVRLTGAWIILIAALFVVPANMTGEEAEEMIENDAGIVESRIHDHEEAAEIAFIFTLISGAAALSYIAASRWKNQLLLVTTILVVLACAISLFTLIDASHKGGLIKHPELLQSNQINTPDTKNNGESIDED